MNNYNSDIVEVLLMNSLLLKAYSKKIVKNTVDKEELKNILNSINITIIQILKTI